MIVLAYLWLPFMIIPIYAGLERLPDSLLEASSDLGARFGSTYRRVVFPMLLPSIVAGSVFTFSLTLGDYIAVGLVGGKTQMIGSIVYSNFAVEPAARVGVRGRAGTDHDRVPAVDQAHRRVGEPLMRLSRGVRAFFAGDDRARDRVPVPPAVDDRGAVVQHRDLAVVPAEGRHAQVVAAGGRQPRRPRRVVEQRAGRDRGDARGARARHAGVARRAALPVLRAQHVEPDDRAADRAAGHRHRHRPQRRVPPGRHPVRHADADHRPRHVLHRGALQQRAGAAAADCRRTSRRPRPTSAPTRSRPTAT